MREILNSSSKEELKKSIIKYAKKAGIKVNKKNIGNVIQGLLIKKKKFGEIYCPCRVVTGNKQKDKDIICPCIFHMKEVKQQGHCLCQLFIK